MRSLSQERRDLVDAVVAESTASGITAGLLEKDEHLTDALRAIFSLPLEHVRLVFAGGTSLSKAHGLIERMSEDVDIKVEFIGEAAGLSRHKQKKQLGIIRDQIVGALGDLGLEQDADKKVTLNDRRYMHTQWAYERAYGGVASLRPNLQIELVTRPLTLEPVPCTLVSLADRMTSRAGQPFQVLTVSVAETQAEKVLSFLRRFAQHRAGKMQQSWDSALVRHIYDVHCIHASRPELVSKSLTAFDSLVQGDKDEWGTQHPEFAEDPYAVLRESLASSRVDAQTRNEYERNLLPLVYGDFKPHFDEAFVSFEAVASALLATAQH